MAEPTKAQKAIGSALGCMILVLGGAIVLSLGILALWGIWSVIL